jgi:hypothetical protein
MKMQLPIGRLAEKERKVAHFCGLSFQAPVDGAGREETQFVGHLPAMDGIASLVTLTSCLA